MLIAGCAARVQPPRSYVAVSGEVPVIGLPTTPYITTASQVITFVALTPEGRDAAEKSRRASEEGRQTRIDGAVEGAMSGRNSVGFMAVECAIRTLVIFSPICIVVVPAAQGIGLTVERTKASQRETYLPALPSDQELIRVEEKIKERITAQGLASAVIKRMGSDSPRPGEIEFPRLVIRTDSATFTPEGMITIKAIAQVETEAGITWRPTEHRYHLGYAGENVLDRGLNQAEARLAENIASTYHLIAKRAPR
jgi:hypothetical protein